MIRIELSFFPFKLNVLFCINAEEQVRAFAGLGRAQNNLNSARPVSVKLHPIANGQPRTTTPGPNILKSDLEVAKFFRFGLDSLKCATGTDDALLP